MGHLVVGAPNARPGIQLVCLIKGNIKENLKKISRILQLRNIQLISIQLRNHIFFNFSILLCSNTISITSMPINTKNFNCNF